MKKYLKINQIQFEKAINNFIDDNGIMQGHRIKEPEISLNDSEGRYRSWNIIYDLTGKLIKEKIINYDFYTLNMCMFLASWGMYRGSTKLLQRFNYTALIPISKILLKKEFRSLHGLTRLEDYDEDTISKISKLYDELEKELVIIFEKSAPLYSKVSGQDTNANPEYYKDIKSNGVTKTLITKIMLGAFGCTPAFDTYISKGCTKLGIRSTIGSGKELEKTLAEIVEFFISNNFEKDYHYDNFPLMKAFDMAIFGKKNLVVSTKKRYIL